MLLFLNFLLTLFPDLLSSSLLKPIFFRSQWSKGPASIMDVLLRTPFRIKKWGCNYVLHVKFLVLYVHDFIRCVFVAWVRLWWLWWIKFIDSFILCCGIERGTLERIFIMYPFKYAMSRRNCDFNMHLIEFVRGFILWLGSSDKMFIWW